jgi:hypothetical protein
MECHLTSFLASWLACHWERQCVPFHSPCKRVILGPKNDLVKQSLVAIQFSIRGWNSRSLETTLASECDDASSATEKLACCGKDMKGDWRKGEG